LENEKFRIVYFGSDSLSATVLAQILTDQIDLLFVVTTPPRQSGRGLITRENKVEAFCREKKIPFISPEDLKSESVTNRLRDFNADFFVVVSYGKILPTSILSLPKIYSINLHPSLLPKWRGASPIQFALLNGEKQTGVTVACVSEKVDAGDILLQETIALDPSINAVELEPILIEKGSRLLRKYFDVHHQGVVQRKPQEESQATYTRKIKKEDGDIHWSESAFKIHNQIRAFQPWPGTYTTLHGKRLKMLSSDVIDVAGSQKYQPGEIIQILKEGTMQISTGEGSLQISSVQLEGKCVMNPFEFSLGSAIKVGDCLGG